MKRFHVHVAVEDLAQGVTFYSALFGCEPSVRRDDYAKWMLEDPRVNFAISARGHAVGINHLGIQAEDAAELAEIGARVRRADAHAVEQKGAACCYARSDKYWARDPAGVAWEAFHTLGEVPMFGEDRASPRARRTIPIAGACCVPDSK